MSALPPFVNLWPAPATPTPAQANAAAAQAAAAQAWSDHFNAAQKEWVNFWDSPNGASPIDNMAALGTGAAAAFQLFLATVAYLTSTAPLVNAPPAVTALLSTMTTPPGWAVAFNADGSGSATPTS